MRAGPDLFLIRWLLQGAAACLIVLAPGWASASASAWAAPGITIIPRPADLRVTGETYAPPAGVVISPPPGDPGARRTAAYLAQELERELRRPVRIGPDGDIRLVRSRDPQPAEGYHLQVGARGVTLAAPDDAGLFYGAVTLVQLLERDGTGGFRLPGVEIVDAPRFGWRGVMLDSARHYQSVAWIRRFIDELARHKLNVLHWHLTDDQAWRLVIRKYPRLAEVGGWRVEAGQTARSGGVYTRADVRALVAYAAARHVSIVPEIDIPGHATAALAAYPWLGAGPAPPAPASGWGVYPNLFNPTPETMHALEDILDEVMEMFPSPIIHLGGDEALKDQWQGSPEVQQRIRELGLKDETALQAWMIRRLAAHLAAHGRRMIGWDEILQGDLPDTAAVMSWRGVSRGLAAARSGHDAVLSPVLPLYLDYRQADGEGEGPGRGVFPLRLVYDFDPIPAGAGADPAAAAHVLGVQANIWTELLRSEARVEFAAFPRLAALAEVAWTPADQRDWPDFLGRLPRQLARYRSRGVNAADSALRVRISADISEGGRATVALNSQYPLGELRYTTDGTAPDANAPVYSGPFPAVLPAHLRAVRILGGAALPGAAEAVFPASGPDWSNGQLGLCTAKLALSLESEAGPVVRVDAENPCWLTPATGLETGARLRLSLVSLPFNFELGEDVRQIPLDATAGDGGVLEARLDRCDGLLLAAQILDDPSRSDRGAAILDLPPQSGRHSLCLQLRRSRLGPFWAVARAVLDPRPADQRQTPPAP